MSEQKTKGHVGQEHAVSEHKKNEGHTGQQCAKSKQGNQTKGHAGQKHARSVQTEQEKKRDDDYRQKLPPPAPRKKTRWQQMEELPDDHPDLQRVHPLRSYEKENGNDGIAYANASSSHTRPHDGTIYKVVFPEYEENVHESWNEPYLQEVFSPEVYTCDGISEPYILRDDKEQEVTELKMISTSQDEQRWLQTLQDQQEWADRKWYQNWVERRRQSLINKKLPKSSRNISDHELEKRISRKWLQRAEQTQRHGMHIPGFGGVSWNTWEVPGWSESDY